MFLNIKLIVNRIYDLFDEFFISDLESIVNRKTSCDNNRVML